MKELDAERRWQDLVRLLEPIHGKALGTARNLCRSPGDGDDLYQETVLRAFHKLHTLRDEERFRSWFFAVLLSVHRSRSRRGFWKRLLPLDETPENMWGLAGEDGRMSEEEFHSARRAARALSRLPAEQREALVLHELGEFEAGRRLDPDWQALRSTLGRSVQPMGAACVAAVSLRQRRFTMALTKYNAAIAP